MSSVSAENSRWAAFWASAFLRRIWLGSSVWPFVVIWGVRTLEAVPQLTLYQLRSLMAFVASANVKTAVSWGYAGRRVCLLNFSLPPGKRPPPRQVTCLAVHTGLAFRYFPGRVVWTREPLADFRNLFENSVICLRRADPPISLDALSTCQSCREPCASASGRPPRHVPANRSSGETSSSYTQRYQKTLPCAGHCHPYFRVVDIA